MRERGWAFSRGPVAALWIIALGSGLAQPRESSAQAWSSYAFDAQHSCLSKVGSQLPQLVRWSTPVDEAPPYNGNDLYIHYASPLITGSNNVIVTVRTASGHFYLKAVKGSDGTSVWTQPMTTDYILPPYNWIPTCSSTLTPDGTKLIIPGPGGTVYVRSNPDQATGTVVQYAFYGEKSYLYNPAGFNSSVFLSTPITTDAEGNIYFGFTVNGHPPNKRLTQGGLARISSKGIGSYVTAAAATGDAAMQKVVYNCAPALSPDESTVYVAVNNQVGGDGISGVGYLLALDSTTLATKGKARLKDVRNPSADALLPDDGSATPTVGPDGDVYFGVLEANLPSGNNDRGWLLHFNSDLSKAKIPGSFGWDDTASIVPASLVKSYRGASSYLLLTKYNDYADFGIGRGQNKLAILDPSASGPYLPPGASTQVATMKEVLTVVGVTPNSQLPGVREWCINSAAIDPINRCAVVNSEDGNLYRWSFDTNTLSPGLRLAQATGEAYTPTVIGPDGSVYAINRAVLNCCIADPSGTHGMPIGGPISGPIAAAGGLGSSSVAGPDEGLNVGANGLNFPFAFTGQGTGIDQFAFPAPDQGPMIDPTPSPVSVLVPMPSLNTTRKSKTRTKKSPR